MATPPALTTSASYSSISCWSQCQRLWYYRYILHLDRVSPTAITRLIAGRAAHAYLAQWYRTGNLDHAAHAYQLTVRDCGDLLVPGSGADLAICLHTCLSYSRYYATQSDEHSYTPLSSDLLWSMMLEPGLHYSGRLDHLGLLPDQRPLVVEQKTTAATDISASVTRYCLSDQAVGYVMLADDFSRAWGLRWQPRHYMIDILRKHRTRPQFLRQLREVTNSDIERFRRGIVVTMHEIERAKRERPDINDWPMTGATNGGCMRYQSICEYRELCDDSDLAAALSAEF